MKTITKITWKEGDISYSMVYNPYTDGGLEAYINSDKFTVEEIEVEDNDN